MFLVFGTASASELDEAMEPILTEYLKIQNALVNDKTEGIKPAVEAIEKSAKKLDPEAAGNHGEHYKNLSQDIIAACKKLHTAEDIDATREAFKALSKPIAMWVGMAKPKGMSVMYCPMLKTVWVQRGSEVANPYYGAEMSICGQKVGGAD
jgi:Cu(I)/Ag(I) efflux system membrane fusion protein